MASYRIANLALNVITPKAPIHESTSRIHSNGCFKIIPKIPIQESCSRFDKRSSSIANEINRYQYYNANVAYCRLGFKIPSKKLIAVIIGSWAVISLGFETIPYSKRTHFVFLSRNLEKKIGDSLFEQEKEEYKEKILPKSDPEFVRVTLILKDIIGAVEKGSNPKWVQKGQNHGSKTAISHLGGFDWEILVVKEPYVNAFCLPGGKIVLFTGLLEKFKSDDEIATIIGHEVGHVLGRHSVESFTKNLLFALVQMVLSPFVNAEIGNALSKLLFQFPFSRRMEKEADYIGLLLVASAGYDPRLVPRVYEKLAEATGELLENGEYMRTHPSGINRAKLLGEAKVMEEALTIYREVIVGLQ